MALYLVESVLTDSIKEKQVFEQKAEALNGALTQLGASLAEIQVSKDFSRAFFIVDSEGRNTVNESFRNLEIPISLVKSVRLVGQQLEEARQQAVNFLVEWNLPENLTMDAYLDRKKTNSVHYAEVPEVEFARTYVCEDMTKCLCFYDAPSEGAVKKAREAVKAPIDSITEILNTQGE